MSVHVNDGSAHARGDCWPPTCLACELEDNLEEIE